jgi:hypothetical protein
MQSLQVHTVTLKLIQAGSGDNDINQHYFLFSKWAKYPCCPGCEKPMDILYWYTEALFPRRVEVK